ncbi:hypothetical protein [Kutzneria sp. NPDC051319]|uniref:hypothetical protein n=1 Tax=Kutzneria sp. NPDC051319 TaxID=3155047 RepID=UPI0034270B27
MAKSVIRFSLAAALIAGGVALSFAGAAFGAPPTPPQSGDSRAVVHAGNVTTCAAAGLAGGPISVTATVVSNTYITITALPAGTTVTGVVVKGAPAYNVYLPGSLGTLPWTALHPPLAGNSGMPATISHWFVCGTKTTTTPPPPTTTTTVPTTTTTTTVPATTTTTTTTTVPITTTTVPTTTTTTTVPTTTTTTTVPTTTTTTVPTTTTTTTVPPSTTTTTAPPSTTTTTKKPPVTTTTTTPCPTTTVSTTTTVPMTTTGTTTTTMVPTGTTTLPPTTTAAPVVPVDVPPIDTGGQALAYTGFNGGWLIVLALVLMLAGLSLLTIPSLLVRRR